MGEGIEQSENDIALYVEWEERRDRWMSNGGCGTAYGRYRKADRNKTHGKTIKVGEEMNCLRCGRRFVKKAAKQRFCSDKCRIRYHNKRTSYY